MKNKVSYLLIGFVLLACLQGCLSMTLVDAGMFDDVSDLRGRIEKGEDVNSRDEDGSTALMYSAMFGHLANVELLLKKGADPNLQDNGGSTALMSLALLDKPQDRNILNLLIQSGADLEIKDNDGSTALDYAVSLGLVKHVQMLLEKGANPNVRDNEGLTPLFGVCYLKVDRAKQIVNLLMKSGVDINTKDQDGDTLSAYDACIEDNELMLFLTGKGLKGASCN